MKKSENTAITPTPSNRDSAIKKTVAIFTIAMLFAFGIHSTVMAQKVQVNVNIDLPSWAPYYENANLVRYYYLPDIECYYDIRSREFIYMEDGQWMFGRSLPRAYGWFNLNDCFIVALDARVFEPWRHFHYYVAHYPRYYYRSYYKGRYMDRDRPLRGFNENERKVVFNRHSEAENHSYDRRDDNRHEEFNKNENRQRSEARHEYQNRKETESHPSESMNYYGKPIGQPVKVKKQMRESQVSGKNQERHHRQR